MSGLIEQLQADALNQSMPVSSLLRKVKVVAVKLKLTETADWVERELFGYLTEKTPQYRITNGRLYTHNAYRGTHPATGDPQSIEMLSRTHIRESVASLEAMLDKSGAYMMSVNPAAVRIFQQNGQHADQLFVQLGENAIAGVIDTVRNMVLDWSLNLESQGIMGEGIRFTMGEKEKAAAANIHISNFHGNLHQGDVSGNQNRVTVSGVDSSSITTTTENVFFELTSAINANVDNDGVKAGLLNIVNKLIETQNTPAFGGWINKLVAVGADYSTVLTPFLPALIAYLS